MRTFLRASLLGMGIGLLPLLPWYWLGEQVPLYIVWITFPGTIVAVALSGPHDVSQTMIAVADCLFYSTASYLVLRQLEKRGKRNAF